MKLLIESMKRKFLGNQKQNNYTYGYYFEDFIKHTVFYNRIITCQR